MRFPEWWPFIPSGLHQQVVDKLIAAEAEVKRLKQGSIPDAIKPKTEEVFRDDEGRVYFRFTDASEMPWRWATLTRVLIEWQKMNLTPELFDEFCDKAIEAANKGDIVKAFQLIGNMRDRRNLLPSVEIVWKLAALLYIRQDEDIKQEPSEKFMKDKIKYWKSKPEIRDFFLSMCLKEFYNFGDKSPAAILESFAQDQQTLSRLIPVTPQLT